MDNNQGITIMEHLINLSMLAINTLIVKIISKIGGYQLAGTLEVAYDSDNHAIDIVYGGLHHQMVKLDKGVTPDQWAMDGRRSWRSIKRIADGIVNGSIEAGEPIPQGNAGDADLIDRIKTLTAENNKLKARVRELEPLEAEEKARQEKKAKQKQERAERKKQYDEENAKRWEEWKKRDEERKAESKARVAEKIYFAGCAMLCEQMGMDFTMEYGVIKKAYRRWMMLNHPDKNPDADQNEVSRMISNYDEWNAQAKILGKK